MPVLAYSDLEVPMTRATDVSGVGLGVVLSQCDPQGNEHVVGYACQALISQERSYCVTHRELLAVIFVAQKFCVYLVGARFFDYTALRWLLGAKEPEDQMACWVQEFGT